MDKWVNFCCFYCYKTYMYKEGVTQKNMKGYAYAFLHNGSTKRICELCLKKNGQDLDREEPCFEDKSIQQEEDGIAISVEDYKILKFARSNPICRILYKVLK